MKQAAVYTRISQDRIGEALGTARQEAECRELVARKGWTLSEVYEDNDASASSGKPRPAYLRMLADIKAGRIEAVAVWDADRLHRRPIELEEFIVLADAHKVALASVGGEIDLATEQGRLTARIKGAVARHETEQTSRRAKAKQAERAAKGLPSGGGSRPYGFEMDKVTHNETEADVIRRAASMVLNGTSLRQTAITLNKEGRLTTTGKQWSGEVLRNVLLSGRIAGYRQHHDDLIEAVWNPIIDRDTWQQLRQELGADARKTTTPRGRQHGWTGLLTCWKCGGFLGVRTVKGRLIYGCRSSGFTKYEGRNRGGCQGVGILKEFADGVLDELLLRRIEMEHLGELVPQDGTAEQEAEISTLETRLENLAEDHAQGLLDRDAFRVASRKVTERLEASREILRKMQTRSRRRVQLDPAIVRVEWPKMGASERRALAGAYVGKVEVGPARRGDNRPDPNRLRVEWA